LNGGSRVTGGRGGTWLSAEKELLEIERETYLGHYFGCEEQTENERGKGSSHEGGGGLTLGEKVLIPFPG